MKKIKKNRALSAKELKAILLKLGVVLPKRSTRNTLFTILMDEIKKPPPPPQP